MIIHVSVLCKWKRRDIDTIVTFFSQWNIEHIEENNFTHTSNILTLFFEWEQPCPMLFIHVDSWEHYYSTISYFLPIYFQPQLITWFIMWFCTKLHSSWHAYLGTSCHPQWVVTTATCGELWLTASLMGAWLSSPGPSWSRPGTWEDCGRVWSVDFWGWW